jgi:hypothetical protein
LSTPRVYLSGNEVHDKVLKAFAEGCGGELVEGWDYQPSDVAVVFGVYKSRIKESYPRGKIISQQRSKKLDVLVLETGYINRGDGDNHHYAAGWNGLNGMADFCNKGMPSDRWEKLGVKLQPWRESGDHFVLCGQVPWDASVDNENHLQWLRDMATKLKKSRRQTIFRPHPLCVLPPFPGLEYSTAPLTDDLNNAHLVVTHNSNSGVEAIIQGVPAVCYSPVSMIWEFMEGWPGQLESPPMWPREQWAANLAYAQWTLDEMKSGEAWAHLRRLHRPT